LPGSSQPKLFFDCGDAQSARSDSRRWYLGGKRIEGVAERMHVNAVEQLFLPL